MPNVWAHLIFGQELLQHLGHKELLDDRTRNVFNLGCQGPDFLFYHHFWPWQKDKPLSKTGNLLHTKHCGPFLWDMLARVKGLPLSDPLLLYAIGFLTHHILDRNLHPYVFYKSGFGKWKHQTFEVIMDTCIVRKKRGLETYKNPVWKQINVGPALPSGIAEFLYQLTGLYYPGTQEGIKPCHWEEAYCQMIKALKLFHDPTGIKTWLTFKQIEPFVYKRKLEPLDYLNEQHEEWNCPTDPNERYTESVWDLWDKAIRDGTRTVSAAFRWLQTHASSPGYEEAESLFKKELGNLSYETGKPCDLNLKIKYVQPMI